MIEFRHVDKIYTKRSVALNDVSFRVDEGEFVFITGHSGAGKSTLLKILAGIEKPSKGQVLLKGTVISQLSVSAVPYLRRGIGIILQENTLLNDRTVLENTILPLLVTGVSMKNATARGLLALQKVGLTGKENRYPLELSGGNQQRVAIARAIINRPSILIADEPTSSLDKLSAQKIIEVLLEFYRAGVTTIVATHDESLVAQYATRVLEINQGNVLSRKI